MAMETWQMLAVFGARLTTSKVPADMATTRDKSPLTLALNGAAWSRVLNEFLTSGLLRSPMNNKHELEAVLLGLAIVNPNALEICAHDWLAVEGYDLVNAVAAQAAIPAVPAVAARAASRHAPAIAARPYRAAVPAVAAVAGRPALVASMQYLGHTRLINLETNGSAPWELVSLLAGLLGPCLTQAERNRPGSHARLAGESLAEGEGRPRGSERAALA